MKCDELKVYVPQDGLWGLEPEEGGKLVEEETCYLKSDVDDAIAELKAKLDEKDKEIAELKKKCEAEKSIGATFSKNGAELARWVEELRKEIESLKASHYAEMVDAGMRERRLRRALWLSRAERASDKALIFYFAMAESYPLNINGYSDEEKGHTRMRNAIWWRTTWLKVERKCRAKAEEYK